MLDPYEGPGLAMRARGTLLRHGDVDYLVLDDRDWKLVHFSLLGGFLSSTNGIMQCCFFVQRSPASN